MSQKIRAKKPPVGAAGAAYFAILGVYACFCVGSSVYFFTVHQVRNGVMSLLFVLIEGVIELASVLFCVRTRPVFIAGVLLIAVGCILGTCYDFYTKLLVFDVILHGLSGVVFACCGFALMQVFIGEPTSLKGYVACILFGFAFSMMIAVLWELFEYMSTALLGLDMQEDSIIHGFGSYFLAGSHNEIVIVDGIVKTVIYYGDGQTLVIDGYLDIGLYDTLGDMLVCFIGGILFLAAFAIDRAAGGKLRRALILPPAKKFAARAAAEGGSELAAGESGS